MTSTALQLLARPPIVVTRLLVTVRDAGTRRYRPIGFLTHDRGEFRFAYLRREVESSSFRPLPGLTRAVNRPMRASRLFPLFAERVISSRRPDRNMSLEALGLPPHAAPMEVLSRSHGQRVGDTVELLPAPEARAGEHVAFTFLTHGVRYLPEADQERIASLSRGETLRLRPDPSNPVNPRAQLVTDSGDTRLGWLPDPLIEVVEGLKDQRLSVERANGPEVGYHFRLLARLDGQVGDRDLFSGLEWETA